MILTDLKPILHRACHHSKRMRRMGFRQRCKKFEGQNLPTDYSDITQTFGENESKCRAELCGVLFFDHTCKPTGKDFTMNLKEFAQHFGASNWRKAFVIAIEQLVPNGAEIIAAERAAYLAHREGRQRGVSALELKELAAKLEAATAAKREAEQVIIERFGLFTTTKRTSP